MRTIMNNNKMLILFPSSSLDGRRSVSLGIISSKVEDLPDQSVIMTVTFTSESLGDPVR